MTFKEILSFILIQLQKPLYLYVNKLKGIKNLPKKGNFIVSANHHSFLDSILIFLIIYKYRKQRISFLASDIYYKNFFLKIYLDAFESVIINKSDKTNSLTEAKKKLKEGKNIGIYPEGKRTNGKKTKAKTGVIRLAIESNKPIVPIRLTNTHKSWPIGKFPKLNRTNIIIGQPIYFNKTNPDYNYLKNKVEKLLQKIYDLK